MDSLHQVEEVPPLFLNFTSKNELTQEQQRIVIQDKQATAKPQAIQENKEEECSFLYEWAEL